jgi:dienelactone hydrolase
MDQQQLSVQQFGASAANYLSSAVHARGADLQRLVGTAERLRPAHVLDLARIYHSVPMPRGWKPRAPEPRASHERAHPMREVADMKKTVQILAAVALGAIASAHAQTEFTPPAGKGRALVAVSGSMGARAYEPAARKLASFGYDVFLLDGNSLVGDQGVGLKAAIDKAPQSPNALPGKVGVVGFSLGGGQVLGYAPRWSDQVAVVVVMYPLTSVYKDISAVVARIKVPVLMFAGEQDSMKDCCRIATARAIASAAAAINAPFELVTYPNVGHDFVVEGPHYDAKAAADCWARTEAMLKSHLADTP